MIQELNRNQKKAVEHADGPLLVIAGAGTGKTRVIIERICRLLAENPSLPGEGIVGLTYTKKAARQMKWRVEQAAGERGREVWLSTFHSFCVDKILCAEDAGLRPIEPVDYWVLLRRNIAELRLKHYARLAEPGRFLNAFCDFFSRCQDELVSVGDFAEYVRGKRGHFDAASAGYPSDMLAEAREKIEQLEEQARCYAISERILREKRQITYGGQIAQAVQLLRDNPERLAELRSQFQYLLVDEFQDTNYAQVELLRLLAGDGRNIVAVGDDDQAIYHFRGASFSSFRLFMDRFSRADGSGAPEIITLTDNYRSTGRILRAAQEVIACNEPSPIICEKKLVPTHPPGEKVRLCEFPSAAAEAEWVASEIDRSHGELAQGGMAGGKPWSRFAVLYRKHIHRDDLVRALRRRNIPFVVHNLSVLRNTLVRDMLAWMRAVAHPQEDVPFARLMAIPRWGFVPEDLVRLAERSGTRPMQTEIQNAQIPLFASREADAAAELLEILRDLHKLTRRMTARQMFDEIVQRLNVATLASDADQAGLSVLANLIAEWERDSEGRGLVEFLEYFEYYLQAGGELAPEEMAGEDAVQLMTVHGAKGLEFDNVFVIRLSRGDFPSTPRDAVLEFPEDLIKEEKTKGDSHIQEERRLFFVALTRARRRLVLTTALGPRKKPSVFLEDLLRGGMLQAKDLEQSSPRVDLPEEEETAAPVPADASRPGLFTAAAPDSYVYSQAALWARAYHPPTPEPLRLSASALDQYERCGMKYLLSARWRIKGGPHAALSFGNVMHTTLREIGMAWQRGEPLSLEDMELIYKREWPGTKGFEDSYQEEAYRNEGLQQLREFYAAHDGCRPNVLMLEKSIELPIEDNIVLTGRIDRIDRLPDGTVEIVDYKTGSVRKRADADRSLQLSIYAMAAQEMLELEPSRLVFYNLATNDGVGTTRDEKELKKARSRVVEIAQNIRAGAFPAKPGFQCRDCDYRLLCPEQEDLLAIHPARLQSN